MKNIIMLAWDYDKLFRVSDLLKSDNILLFCGYDLNDKDIELINKYFLNIKIIKKAKFKDIESLLRHIEQWGYEVDKVIAIDELCLLQAAILRERLYLDGDNIETVIKFRNKLEMINVLSDQIRKPITKLVTTKNDLQTFVKEHGKSVVKPVDGVGSKEVYIVNYLWDVDEIYLKLREHKTYIVQTYIEGTLCHCDALIVNGKIQIMNSMKYLDNTTEFKGNKFLRSISITDINECQLVETFATKIVDEYKITNNVIHLELFVNGDEVTFCEIAIRAGGGGIVPIIKHLYGVDFYRLDIMRQMGIEIGNVEISAKNEFVSYIIFYPKNGKVKEIKGKELLQNTEYIFYKQAAVIEGEYYSDPIFSSDYALCIAFYADSEEELYDRLDLITDSVKIVTENDA